MTEWKNGIAKLSLPTPFPVGDVNVFLINGDQLTLVDAGPKTKEAWDSLNWQLKKLGLTSEDIEQVILTHHHPDHAGLLDFFPQELKVYGHSLNARWLYRTDAFLEFHDMFYQNLFLEFGIPEQYFSYIGLMRKTLRYSCERSLNGILVEGGTPPALGDWEVIETPGHAQSHIGLYRKEDGVFIGGDLLLANISPNPLLEPPLPGQTERQKPQLQLNHSLNKVLHFPITCAYPGHGPDIYDTKALIEKRLTQQRNRALLVKSWLEKEMMSVFEICQRLFPKVYERELSLTISETVAQLDYLVDLGEINAIQKHAKIYYSAN